MSVGSLLLPNEPMIFRVLLILPALSFRRAGAPVRGNWTHLPGAARIIFAAAG